MVTAADKDKSGFLDKEEFLALVARQWEHLEEVQSSKFKQYLRVAAYADHYRWWPPPFFTIATVLTLTGVHIHHSVLLASQPLPLPAGPLCSPFILHPGKRYQAWRFFTYSLVHATGYEHLLVNLVLLLLVALPLEMSHGGLRVGAVYSLAVLAASLTSSLFQPGTFLAGASGGVYALSTAHLASMLLNWREDSLIMRQRVRNRQAAAPTFGKVVRFGRILLVSSILAVDVLGSLVGEQKSSISHLAHLVGAVVGLLVGLVLLRNRRVEHWQTWVRGKSLNPSFILATQVRGVACCLAGVAILALAILNIAAAYILPPAWQPDLHYNLTACDQCVNFRRSC